MADQIVLNGRYQINERIDGVALMDVYEATDLNLERRVAVKVLRLLGYGRDRKSQQDRLERFRQEVRQAAQIEHSHAARVYDMGLSPELKQPYVVTEFLKGRTLHEELARNGPMSPSRAFALLHPCLEALAVSHRQRLVHKNVSPASLFLTRPGSNFEQLFVIDFGLAHCIATDTYVRQTGRYAGQPAYMAPEYIERQHISPAMDVYQAALVLVEMLTGRRVVDSTHGLSCCARHLHGDFSLPADLASSPLGPPIARALLRNSWRRFPDAGVFLRVLESVPWAELPTFEPGAPRIPMHYITRAMMLDETATIVEDLGPTLDLVDTTGVVEASGDRRVIMRSRYVKRVRMRAAVLSDDVMLRVHRDGGDPLDPYVLPMIPHLGLYLFESTFELPPGTDTAPATSAISLEGLEGPVLVELEPIELYPDASGLELPDTVRGVYQVTDLGVALFSDGHTTLVHVSSIKDERPIEGCQVTLSLPGGERVVLGKTGSNGLVDSDAVHLAPEQGAVMVRVTDKDWENQVVLTVPSAHFHPNEGGAAFRQSLASLVGQSSAYAPLQVVEVKGG